MSRTIRSNNKVRRNQYNRFILDQESGISNVIPGNIQGVPANAIASNLLNYNLTVGSLIGTIFAIGISIASIFLASFLNRGGSNTIDGSCPICNDLQIIVNKDGTGNFTTIRDALDFASQGTNFSILVAPGTYEEDNPLEITQSNSLSSVSGGGGSVIVVPLNPSDVLFEMEGASHLNGIKLLSQWDAGGIGVHFNGQMQNSDCFVQDLIIENFTYGIVGQGNPNSIYLVNVVFSTRADNSTFTEYGIISRDGGSVITADTGFAGRPNSFLGTYFQCEGSSSSVSTFSRLTIIGGGGRFLNRFLFVDGGCRITINGISTGFYIEGIIVDGNDSSILDINSLNFIGDGFNQVDLNVLSGDHTIQITSSTIDFSKFLNINSIRIDGFFYSPANVLNGQFVLGAFSVGDFVQPTRSAFGSGDFSFITMRVFTSPNDLEISFTDITNLANTTQTRFDIFESPMEDASTYIGANTFFPGLRFRDILPFTKNFTERAIEISYFDNGTMDWEPLKFMVTKAGIPHTHRAQIAFENEESQEIRFGSTEGWVRSTLNGVSLFWVRLRVNGTLNNVPSATLIRFHTDSTVINDDGWIEYFGIARPLNRFPWDYSGIQILGPSPTNQDFYVSEFVGIGRTENQFSPTGNQIVGFTSFLPLDLDTSVDVKFTISFAGRASGSGTVRWAVRYATVAPGEFIFLNSGSAPPVAEDEVQIIFDVFVDTELEVVKAFIPLDISNIMVPDPGTRLLIITVSRLGSDPADTYPTSVVILDIDGSYLSWNNGGFGTLNPFFRPSIPPFFGAN